MFRNLLGIALVINAMGALSAHSDIHYASYGNPFNILNAAVFFINSNINYGSKQIITVTIQRGAF